MLLVLGDGARDVSTLRAETGGARPTLSNHLALLRLEGLVEFGRESPRRVYALTAAGRGVLRVVEAPGR